MSVFVTDFDGTITRHDFYRLVIDELKPKCGTDHWTAYTEGRISHFDALNLTFAEAEVGEARLIELADRMEPDPALAEGLKLLNGRGFHVVIVSAGCRWYIDRILEKAGATGLAEVHANDGWIEHDRLVMRRPFSSKYHSDDTGVDKVAVVRDSLRRDPDTAFAGNGPPDFAPALLVRPERRFARADLAEALARADKVYRTFERWIDVVNELAPPLD